MAVYRNLQEQVYENAKDIEKLKQDTSPEEVKKLIEHILEFLGAEKTDDPCVWDLSGEKKDTNKEEETEKEEDTKEEPKSGENKDNASSEDVEDDKSRDENDLL